MDTFLLAMVGTALAGTILLVLEYRTKWFARALDSARGKKDGVSKAVNLTVQAPGQNSRASIQGVTTYQIEGDLVINAPGHVAEAQSAGVPVEGEYKAHPTPVEIFKQLAELSVFQRSLVAESYVGLKVRWLVSFQSINELSERGITFYPRHSVCANYEGQQRVHFQVDVSKFPEFKIMKEQQQLWVYGEIGSIEVERAGSISLWNAVAKVAEVE